MKKRSIALSIFIVLAVVNVVFSNENNPLTIDRISAIVLLLEDQKIGTGTFVSDTNRRTFIVTAAHVAKKMNDKTKVTFRVDNDIPYKINLKEILHDTEGVRWTYHPRSDAAAIELKIPNSKRHLFNQNFLPITFVKS